MEAESTLADSVEVRRVIILKSNPGLLARLWVGSQLEKAVVVITFDLARLDIRLAARLEAVLGQASDWTRKP